MRRHTRRIVVFAAFVSGLLAYLLVVMPAQERRYEEWRRETCEDWVERYGTIPVEMEDLCGDRK